MPNLVFQLLAPTAVTVRRDFATDVSIECVDAMDQMSALAAELDYHLPRGRHGPTPLISVEEAFRQGRRLWTLRKNMEIACFGWASPGEAVTCYYFPLREQDGSFNVLLSNFWTNPKFRGKGLYPLLLRHIAAKYGGDGRGIIIHTQVWNDSAISSIEEVFGESIGTGTLHAGQLHWQPREQLNRTGFVGGLIP